MLFYIYIKLCGFYHLAIDASGLHAVKNAWYYNAAGRKGDTLINTSSIDSYPGFDLPMQNHRHFLQAEHEYDTSGFLSAGYGARSGLPETSLYRSMKTQVLLGKSEGQSDTDEDDD